jgi:TPP-dependent pyruvate/acetoin dehydrogenase alpha subunit
MEAKELIDFETEIATLFEQGEIKSPCHLSGGNEERLIEIFKSIKPTDWVFSTHRSHYHALLKGIPKEWIKQEILDNHSITLNNAEYRFFSSAIVGGVLPIALGVAMTGQKVWVFCGDMASETGIFNECLKYATNFDLPIKFIVENNNFSVNSKTDKVWGYRYKRKYPHQGSGKWVTF